MKLNERKLNILKAIVKDYIETAEAVGSRTISKKHDLGISAATIRNEMADLEELGYLIQPHTSAGRVPSPEVFRWKFSGFLFYFPSAPVHCCPGLGGWSVEQKRMSG